MAPTAGRVGFLYAGKDRLAELHRTVQPLARKLATVPPPSPACRTRHDRPAAHSARPARPELVLLGDVSGSVSGFPDFTMLLVQAPHDQFSKVRVFAFVNRVDERPAHGLARQRRLRHRPGRVHGAYGGAVGPRMTVFVRGDARTNMSDPNGPAACTG